MSQTYLNQRFYHIFQQSETIISSNIENESLNYEHSLKTCESFVDELKKQIRG